jgi:cation:H+ antiporter
MFWNVYFLILGLALLIYSAKWLTTGSAQLAKRLGISPLIIGIVVVAFGTSAPEIFVTVTGAITGQSNVSLGNIVGSNIANIGLILGTAAIINPIPISKNLLRQDIPLFLIVSFALFIVSLNHVIGRWEGIIFVGCLAGFFYYYYLKAKTSSKDLAEIKNELKELSAVKYSNPMNVFLITLGLAGLTYSSDLLVENATAIAKILGIPDFVIAATIIALGTSLPELATSIMAAVNKELDLALGNVIGSNIWNVLAGIGLATTIMPISVSDIVLYIDIPIMLLFTVSFCLLLLRTSHLSRPRGTIILIGYFVYVIQLYL